MRTTSKLHKVSKRWLGVAAVAVIGVSALAGYTFAKYYANNSNKGVTAAADYYFSSDVLDKAVSVTDDVEVWKDVYNTAAWDGKSAYDFEVKIRNYQNQLLYNSENLDITYQITFELLDSDKGSYSVAYGAENYTELTEGTPVTFEKKITGGKAKADTFKVQFKAPKDPDESYQSQGIQVVAEITGPDFLTKTPTKIGGVLHVGIVKAEYSLEGKYDFSVPSLDNEWSTETKAVVDGMAAFPYIITYTPGTDNAAHMIRISWNNKWLELDYFNENYANVVTEDGISYIEVYIQPKEKIKLAFYRTDEFDLNVVTPEMFRGLITVTDLDLKSDETSSDETDSGETGSDETGSDETGSDET